MKSGTGFISAEVLITLLFLLIGIALGVVIRDFPYLTFDTKLAVGDIASFLLTFFIAIYIPFYLDKKINNKRMEKDILIADCVKFESDLSELHRGVEEVFLKDKILTKLVANKIILKLRAQSNLLSILKDKISEYSRNRKFHEIIDILVKKQYSYNDDLTLNFRNRNAKISSDTFRVTELNYFSYCRNITKLKMLVNSL